MSGICPKMNGAKCAMNQCEFWNIDELACSIALESHKRVELLNVLIEKAEKLAGDVRDKDELKALIKEFNIVDLVEAIQ